MKALKVKPEIVSLLYTGKFETFSVPSFRDAYLESIGDTSKPTKVVSQLIKRHLRKLEERGVLERINTGKPHPIRYRIKDRSQLIPAKPSVGADVAPSEIEGPLPGDVVHSLKGKLSKYRTEMLSATGALEEYEAIVQLQPGLQQAIQKKYDQTREEYAKTLGKVRALESLIGLQTSSAPL